VFDAVPVIAYVPTSDVEVAVVVKDIPKSSPSTTVPSVTVDVNVTSSSPYALVLLSIVTFTALAVISYVPSTNVTA
jgi:hypothetical protein